MTTLKVINSKGIEVSLVQDTGRYLVSVLDDEGLLHQTEFRFGARENQREVACVEALDWFDNVHSCVEEYLQRPTSQSIRSLVSFLH